MVKTTYPTLILHGWTQDTQGWQPLLKLLHQQGVSAKFLKIPGLTAKLDKPWHLSDYHAWFVREVSRYQYVNVIAHSFGGRIAIRFDVKNPNVVKKLILIDSAGLRPSNVMAVVKRVSFRALAKIGKTITTNPKARHLLYRLAGEQDYYRADKILAQTMTNIISEDQRSELPFVKAHTLIIWGGQDQITPISDGRFFNNTIMGSTLKIIDNAGHSPQYSHPQLLSQFITDFLSNKK